MNHTEINGNAGRAAPAIKVKLGPNAMKVQCPYCNNSVQTEVDYSRGLFTYLSSLVIMSMGCFCGCCLIPCCSDGYKNCEHACPVCGNYLGTYHRR